MEIYVFCTIQTLMGTVVHWQQYRILRILPVRTINSGNDKLSNVPRQFLKLLVIHNSVMLFAFPLTTKKAEDIANK